MPRHLTVEDHEGIALVRIDRPPANAMDLELLEEGSAVLDELGADLPDAVVLTGSEGFFSAGVDLKLAPTLDLKGQRDMVAGINGAFAAWYSFPRPVVCAVNGHAIAGGLILALCGDHRIGTDSGKLGLTELRAGVPYPVVAMAVVQAELSKAAARRLVLGAELIEMKEALGLDLLDELAPPDELLDRALTRAREMAAAPSETYARVKHQLRGQVLDAVDGGRDDPLAESWLGDDTAGAARGILESP
jgi:enoyl-CoA hydratase